MENISLSHLEIMAATITVNKQGSVFCIHSDGKQNNFVEIFNKLSVHPAHFNLLASASIMYQTLQGVSDLFDGLIRHAEENGFEKVANALTEKAATVQLSLRIAREGILEVTENPNNRQLKG